MNSNLYVKLLNEIDNGNSAVLATCLKSNGTDSVEKVLFSSTHSASEMPDWFSAEDMDKSVTSVFESGKILWIDNGDNKVLLEPFFPSPKLIVLGGGHIAVPLVEYASRCGFEVTITDDRPYFANTERFPSAKEVICDSFENCFNRLKINKSCYIVAATRGHRYDLVCLRNILKYDMAYLGMVGSQRRVRIIKQTMLDEGYSKEKIDSLNAPIGLPIGAITPDEIAISILSQLISARRTGKTAIDEKSASIKGKSLDYDADVIKVLSSDSEEKKAVATIISTKGSVPRHSGAKMLIYPDGRIIGSIGGGCCESEVIMTARDLMNDGGGFRIQEVDMTNAVAEEEGMVCGGTMEVLIEA